MPDASERRTLAGCAFVASLLLFPLGGRLTSFSQIFRDRIAALTALTLAAALFLFHVIMTRREAAATAAPAAGAAGVTGSQPAEPAAAGPTDTPPRADADEPARRASADPPDEAEPAEEGAEERG